MMPSPRRRHPNTSPPSVALNPPAITTQGVAQHLVTITDPAALDTELARVRKQYNTVRLHAGIGYVTPDDEHHGRGPQIRRARAAGMRRARAERIKENRASKS